MFHEKTVYNVNSVARRSYEPYHNIGTTTIIIDHDELLSYNYQALYFKNNIGCVGGRNLFYFNEVVKIQLLHVQKQRLTVENEYTSVLLIGLTEITWNKIYSNQLCVSIFIKDIGFYLGVIVRLHNEECHIYIYIQSES